MLLVDIGNTNIHFAIEHKQRLIKKFQIPTHQLTLSSLQAIINRYQIEEIILCSVVPQVTNIFKQLKQKLFIVEENLSVPIKSYYNRKEIGPDRLVNVFSAKSLFTNPRLVIDLGTAITFDYLTSQGEHLGGFILPGIEISLQGLTHCALISQKIRVKKLTKTIYSRLPTDTQESINRGLIEGTTLMIEGLIKKYKKFLSPSLSIIITGGAAPFFIKNLSFPYIYEPLLLLKGLLILRKIYQDDTRVNISSA